MMQTKIKSNWIWLILVILSLMIPAYAVAAEPENCVVEDKLEKDISQEAELEALTCSFEKWEGSDTLHLNVSVKNVSDKEHRFKVNIFLDNGKAVGGLIPVKVKDEGLVQPGQSASYTYPVKDMPEKPDSITLSIQTLSE